MDVPDHQQDDEELPDYESSDSSEHRAQFQFQTYVHDPNLNYRPVPVPVAHPTMDAQARQLIDREHSMRRVTRIDCYVKCETCSLYLETWYPRRHPQLCLQTQGRCPDCFRVNDSEELQRLLRERLSPLQLMASYLCVCPCECSAEDNKVADPDFIPARGEEEEDCIDSDIKFENNVEQNFARNHGLRTNAFLHADTDDERPVFVESAGHHEVARSHDIGIPAESSLANVENYITATEVNQLGDRLEPWEAEAVLAVAGRNRQEITALFPEVARINVGQTHGAPHSEPLRVCSSCHKPPTDACVEWLETATVGFCDTCGLIRRPSDITRDPDWHIFNPIVSNLRDHCHCRCDCAAMGLLSVSDEESLRGDNDGNGEGVAAIHEVAENPYQRIERIRRNISPALEDDVESSPQFNFRLRESGYFFEPWNPDLRNLTRAVQARFQGERLRELLERGIRELFLLPTFELHEVPIGQDAAMEIVANLVESAATMYATETYYSCGLHLQLAVQIGLFWARVSWSHISMRHIAEIEMCWIERVRAWEHQLGRDYVPEDDTIDWNEIYYGDAVLPEVSDDAEDEM